MVTHSDNQCSYQWTEGTTNGNNNTENQTDQGWNCTRGCVEHEEYCEFHLSPTERRKKGISDEEINRRIINIVREGENKDSYEFVGAQFEYIDLKNIKLETSTTHPINLKNVSVDKYINLNQSKIGTHIELSNSDINILSANDAEIQGGININNTHFSELSLVGMRIDGDLSAERIQVDSTTTCDEIRLNGDSSFENAHFCDTASFKGAEFRGEDNLLNDDVSFKQAQFDSETFFNRAKFWKADFNGSKFYEKVEFIECRFNSDAEFNQTEFYAESVFTGVEFEGGDNVKSHDADFKHCLFENKVWLDHTKIRDIDFSGAKFKSELVCCNSTITGEGKFENITVNEGADFTNCLFTSDLSFINAEFNGWIDFSESQFHDGDTVANEEVVFDNTIFHKEVKFLSVDFAEVSFDNVVFHSSASYMKSKFRNKASFKNCIYNSSVRFGKCEFHYGADFSRSKFDGEASFAGADLNPPRNLEEDSVIFNQTKFNSDLVLTDAKFGSLSGNNIHIGGCMLANSAIFTGEITIKYGDFEENINFKEAIFERRVSLIESSVKGDFEASKAVFGDAKTRHPMLIISNCDMSGLVVFEDAWISGADISDNEYESEVDFSETWFDSSVSFKHSKFSCSAKFDHAVFDNDVDFSQSEFGNKVNFKGTEFNGGEHSVEGADFRKIKFKEANFAQTDFNYATFAGSCVDGQFDFTEANCTGVIDFSNVELRAKSKFSETSFHDEVKFISVNISEKLEFIRTMFYDDVLLSINCSENEIVDMSHALLTQGRLTHKGEDSPNYNLSRATLKEINFEGDNKTLDYLKFENTEFNGFDFSHHKLMLAENNYTLHHWNGNKGENKSNNNSSLSPAILESTYLKAKNGAAEFGDRKAAAEFFIKEMIFRRKKYMKIIRGNTRTQQYDHQDFIEEDLDEKISELKKGGDIRTRFSATGKWIGNWVLYQTCGYGERLWRVMYISVMVICVFAFLFTTVTKGTKGVNDLATSGVDSLFQLTTPEGIIIFIKNLYFSIITFTTLGYGDIRPVGSTARTLAGIESFLGALLLALVVFVLGRRVAW